LKVEVVVVVVVVVGREATRCRERAREGEKTGV
jgi:hypothetical protein